MPSIGTLGRSRAPRDRRPLVAEATPSSIGAALANPDVEGLVLCASLADRPSLVRACLEAGRHALAPAPLAARSEQAESLVSLAAERGLVLQPRHTLLHARWVETVAELVRSRALGDLLAITLSRTVALREGPRADLLREIAPDELAVLRYWTGEVADETFVLAHKRPTGFESFLLGMRFASGTLVQIDLNHHEHADLRRITLTGTRSIVARDVSESDDAGSRLSVELDSFRRAICDAEASPASAALALDVVRMLAQVDTAAALHGEPSGRAGLRTRPLERQPPSDAPRRSGRPRSARSIRDAFEAAHSEASAAMDARTIA